MGQYVVTHNLYIYLLLRKVEKFHKCFLTVRNLNNTSFKAGLKCFSRNTLRRTILSKNAEETNKNRATGLSEIVVHSDLLYEYLTDSMHRVVFSDLDKLDESKKI